ncbi:MbcA/ParS/Xre antitoxin family protein [Ottowia testudinis]|uniref:DUF2384 domain-containing protein n=1 Tax=Ottowia testudinis TaxID=2816950 RepID=A0A975CN36_9BURK|nr:MbcA/ParS/Xre antitoxin family protein [Ottowia testudinis]QTD46528.1 DUF2384 domain-containing protein [Ottowia testudinis]
MNKRKATKIPRKSSAKLKKMLAEFDVSQHGGERMAYEPVGVEFPSKAEPQGSTSGRYRTVDRKGRIYLQEDLIGMVFRITAQSDGTWLLEPTDEVSKSERWAHAPKMARALERINRNREPAAYEADDGPLTERDLREIRAIAAKQLRKGKLLRATSLFQSDALWPTPPTYDPSAGVDGYLDVLRQANPLQIVALERAGVADTFVADLAERMAWSPERLHKLLGHEPELGHEISGGWETAGGGVMGLVRLIELARGIVADSTREGAEPFDAILWLGIWLNLPQPTLGGLRANELLDTPTGASLVAKVLGSIGSGAYQ